MDRRTKSRIEVQLTCCVGDGRVLAATVCAFTENVSRTGLLMRWIEGIPVPEIEGRLVVDLQLPENSEFGPRVMRCRTEVRRVTPAEGGSHDVALRILSMRVIKIGQVRASELASMQAAGSRVS